MIRGRIVGVTKIKRDSSSEFWDRPRGFSWGLVFTYAIWFGILALVNIFFPLTRVYDFSPTFLNLSLVAFLALGFTLATAPATIFVDVVLKLLRK